MTQTTRPRVIFFDLDSTLFDHHHSLCCAMSEARHTLNIPDTICLDTLTDFYNQALDQTYGSYRSGDLKRGERKMDRLRRFFRLIGREDASDQELLAFRTAYKKRYRSSYRATPGTIETLTALREQGYKIGIITNAGRASQQDKIDGIGISHLIDGLIASGDFKWAKPDSRIFRHAMSEFGITYDMRREDGTTYMVGDSIQNDVEGAARAGLDPVLYSPESSEWFMEVWGYGYTVPIINHMSQLLDIV